MFKCETFTGQAVSLNTLDNDILELSFDLQGGSVNKLNSVTLDELQKVTALLSESTGVKGLLISSAKPAFIVGADITEFKDHFSASAVDMKTWVQKTHQTFSTIENLPFPTVAAINGMALGGGFELALLADYRILASDAKVGLPEVNLGLCPGWGGTVRLSRLTGAEVALQWLLTGKPVSAAVAQQQGAVDSVVESNALREAAIAQLDAVIAGNTDYLTKRAQKHCSLETLEGGADFSSLEKQFSKQLDPNYPAASVIFDLLKAHSSMPFNDALDVETDSFVSLAHSDVAKSLVGLFMNDQLLKKKSKQWGKQAEPVAKSAVLGAGIMGGGVAFQSASTGTPIVMKDIREDALTLGLKTATKLLDRKIEKGRLDEAGKAKVLGAITPTLEYGEFDQVGLVVEAVVENPAVKAAVLADVEGSVSADTVLASNTSTISIDTLAENLSRPEQFCGMHFFNPVHLMPLVEVIRGAKTSEQTIARTVAYATAMGKSPIVVNNCPGFLVNRILFPYFNAFNRLLLDGVDFQRIDKVMEQFGWPMGPAYLADVVGIDTLVHADHVMQEGFPERMGHDGDVIAELLLAANALGQKNGQGFYEYGVDENGRRYKEPSGQCRQFIAERVSEVTEISDQEIIDRMMIPMCMEAVRCLDDGIVESAAEVDMGLIMGLGFPRFRGGALRYIDTLGLDNFAKKVEANAKQGPLYQLTDGFNTRLSGDQSFY